MQKAKEWRESVAKGGTRESEKDGKEVKWGC